MMNMKMRPLRGACHCGRNRYRITVPPDSIDQAQVLFNTESAHENAFATPLAAYIRVPLSWYHSATYAYFEDETHAKIRKSYTPFGAQDECRRYFCGYCGTQLSYWSESPPTEAKYIHLTLGSLLYEDMHDLGAMGLIPDDSSDSEQGNEGGQGGGGEPTTDMEQQDLEKEEPDANNNNNNNKTPVLRQLFGVPWFEDLIQGTRLGKMRRRRGGGHSHDGKVQVEWEIVEYSDNGKEDDEDVDMVTGLGKRKLGEREEDEKGEAK